MIDITKDQKESILGIKQEIDLVCGEIGSLEVMYAKQKADLMRKYETTYGKLSQFVSAISMANGIDVSQFRFSMKAMAFEEIAPSNSLSVVK